MIAALSAYWAIAWFLAPIGLVLWWARRWLLTPWGRFVSMHETKSTTWMTVKHVSIFPPFSDYTETYFKGNRWWVRDSDGKAMTAYAAVSRDDELDGLFIIAQARKKETEELAE